jgi:uncharacterized membrane protein YhaH (DUF805 family)
MVFCRGCGAQIHESAPMCPKCGAPQDLSRQSLSSPAADDDQRPRTFASSIAICFNRYFQFRGRAPRAEYWYFTLFTTLVGLGADLIDAVWFGSHARVFGGIINIAMFVPSIAVWTRRMHDIDRSGWWWLLAFLPIIGWIILLVWLCTAGTRGPNRYGSDPLGGSGAWAASVSAAE